MKISTLLLGSLALAISAATAPADVYNGNGATGFGGNVGLGALTITADTTAQTVTFSFTPSTTQGSGNLDTNSLVLYVDSQAGGYGDTSQFTDTGDGGRESISGFNPNNPSRSLVTFPSGFTADYGFSIENGYFGMFALGTGSFNFVTGANQTGTAPYVLTVTAAQLGLPTLTLGTAFSFVGTYTATSAYRSNETIGTSTTVVDPGNPGGSPNAGYNGTVTFTSADTFPVPEPDAYACMALGAAALVVVSRRRARRA